MRTYLFPAIGLVIGWLAAEGAKSYLRRIWQWHKKRAAEKAE